MTQQERIIDALALRLTDMLILPGIHIQYGMAFIMCPRLNSPLRFDIRIDVYIDNGIIKYTMSMKTARVEWQVPFHELLNESDDTIIQRITNDVIKYLAWSILGVDPEMLARDRWDKDE